MSTTADPSRPETGRTVNSRSVVGVAFVPADGSTLSYADKHTVTSAVRAVAPERSDLSISGVGARVVLPDGVRGPTSTARDLVDALARLRLSDGRRLCVGAGVASPDRTHSDLEAVAVRAEAAAQESLAARDHVVVGPTAPSVARGPLAVLQRQYGRTSAARRASWLLVTSAALAVVPSFVVYCLAGALGYDLAAVMFWVVFAGLAFTAVMNYSEAFAAFDPPAAPPEPDRWPAVTLAVSAYLSNEVDVIVNTCRALLDQEYPGRLQVILAYNGPAVPAVEAELAELSSRDRRFVVMAVPGSTSKAQNVNAVLDVADGEIFGVFDADHRPAPDALRRAGRWLADGTGVDVVQGHCAVRNGEDGWLQRMVAVEFEAIYAVGHPGRAGLHQFGIFGGSNGFWRTELLRRVRLRPRMLTEDIDASVRALLDGARIVSDPGLVSFELAPATGGALWSQRIRWAQGWSQVSMRYWYALLTSPCLSARQRLGSLWLTVWREGYPWLSAQMFPLLAYQVFVRRQQGINWLLLFFCLSTLMTSAVGPIQSLFARRLALPHLRTPEKRWWWWQYLVLLGAPYGEWRTAVCRAAHLREALGDRGWVVTPRAATQDAPAFLFRGPNEGAVAT